MTTEYERSCATFKPDDDPQRVIALFLAARGKAPNLVLTPTGEGWGGIPGTREPDETARRTGTIAVCYVEQQGRLF